VSYQIRQPGWEVGIVTPVEDVVHAVLKGIALRRKVVFARDSGEYLRGRWVWIV